MVNVALERIYRGVSVRIGVARRVITPTGLINMAGYGYRDHPSDGFPDLMAWSQSHGCESNQGQQSAADGDLDIGYALLLADKQWGSDGDIDYKQAAARIIAAIKRAEIDESGSYVRLGDWTDPDNRYYYDATRSSDFMPGHFASFAEATADESWNQVSERSYNLFQSIQSQYAASTGLFPDFVVRPINNPSPAPADFLERSVDGQYSFNACRVPWRIAASFLTNGDVRARNLLRPLNEWIRAETGEQPSEVTSGYWLDGDSLPGSYYTSAAFLAPFGVSAMIDAENQDWLNKIWDALVSLDHSPTYYDDTLKLLSMIAMSGNWWAPESAPCPN